MIIYSILIFVKINLITKLIFNEYNILNELLSHCNVFLTARNVIIMNNVSIHYNARIKKLIILHECKIRYLLSYSLNFNLIKLNFNVLKI